MSCCAENVVARTIERGREPVEVLVEFDGGVRWTEDFVDGTVRFDKPPKRAAGPVIRCGRCRRSVMCGGDLLCVYLLRFVRPDFFCACCERREDDAPAMHLTKTEERAAILIDRALRVSDAAGGSWKGSARNEEGE